MCVGMEIFYILYQEQSVKIQYSNIVSPAKYPFLKCFFGLKFLNFFGQIVNKTI